MNLIEPIFYFLMFGKSIQLPAFLWHRRICRSRFIKFVNGTDYTPPSVIVVGSGTQAEYRSSDPILSISYTTNHKLQTSVLLRDLVYRQKPILILGAGKAQEFNRCEANVKIEQVLMMIITCSAVKNSKKVYYVSAGVDNESHMAFKIIKSQRLN